MKVVRRYSTGIEAHLMRSKLQDEGVLSFVFDEQINTINPLYNVATGGIRLMVHEADLQQAQKILEALDREPYKEGDKDVVCSKCGSKEVMVATSLLRDSKGILTLLLSFLMLVFPIYNKQVYVCRSCGHEFDKN